MENNGKRFIEESFPVKEVGIESAKEKNIHRGHISTLHVWWARRPLASSRATCYAALIPYPSNIIEQEKTRKFIINFSKWENSLNDNLIIKAREDIFKANNEKSLKILDPYGGGGSIPLETLRLGCETYSNDYNPVAVLVQKCILEYPQLYGKSNLKNDSNMFKSTNNCLIDDIVNWENKLFNDVSKNLAKFYPNDKNGDTPLNYIWARTVKCQNPSCENEIVLMRQYWLSKKANKKVIIYPYIRQGLIQFKILGDGYENIPKNFNPDLGTISKAVVTCPFCGSVIDDKTLKKLFLDGKSGQRMIAVVLYNQKKDGKKYRAVEKEDLEVFKNAGEYLYKIDKSLTEEWGISSIPDEPTPEGKGGGAERAFYIRNYNLIKFGDLFNNRQKLALVLFANGIRKVYSEMLREGLDGEYAKAITTYLAFGISRIADRNSSLSVWNVLAEKQENTFGRQTLPMVWDYSESNIINGSQGWKKQFSYIIEALKNLTISDFPAKITHQSATSLSYPNDYFDAIFTDPPYYDNVPYSYLSDFFYVWLKRSVGLLYPELFSTTLTPKKNEIVVYSNIPGGFNQGKIFFEEMLGKSFKEIYRVLKPNGIAIIVYAHKSTEGWETLINSLLDSGLIVTGAWPINTERAGRMRANDSAALASSIYIVARKMERQPTGFYNTVKEELKTHLNKKLERLWHEGVTGADFFIAAIGSAIEIYGKYKQVMDYEGNIVRANRLLDDVRKIATDYAVKQILHNGFAGEISDLARLYVLWRWNYGEVKVPFDEARKLGQSCGVDVSQEWNRAGFIKKDKEFVRVLGPQDRKLEDLEGSTDLVDVLHYVLLLWEKSRRDEMLKVLQNSSFGNSEAFYRVAQAISETLPIESKEKKLLDGFLAGRERLREEVRKELVQTKLDT